MIMKARYPGRCEKCGDPINPGDTIEWHPGTPGWHETCPETSGAGSRCDAEDHARGPARAEGRAIRVKIIVLRVAADEGE